MRATVGRLAALVTTALAFALLAAPAPAAVDLKVDFGPATAVVASGYVSDSGAPYDTTRGRGWIREDSVDAGVHVPLDMSSTARERGMDASVGGDQRLDTLVHLQFSGVPSGAWEAAVPAGTYDVTVTVGDPQYLNSVHWIRIEGVAAISGFVPTTAERFATVTKRVTVSDGRVTVDGIGGTTTKVTHLEVRSVLTEPPPPPPSELRVDFAPAGAAVPAGYVADSGAAYDAARGRGWIREDSVGTAAPVPVDMSWGARERSVTADQRLRTLLHLQLSGYVSGAWEAAVPSGTYDVTVAVGDPQYLNGVHQINLERQPAIVGFVPTSATPNKVVTTRVTVTDGRLTVDAIGGTTTRIAYLEVKPATADTTPPAAPSGLTATPGDGRVALRWNAGGEADLAGYDVFRSTTLPVPTSGQPRNGETLLTNPAFNDSGLTNGTTYHYVVQAVDSSGNAATSATVSAKPAPAMTSVLSVDFGPAGAAVPAGYKADTGAPWSSTRGYGWWAQSSIGKRKRRAIDMSPWTYERGLDSDQRRDTVLFMQPAGAGAGAWEATLPNGSYTVTVAVGDPASTGGSTHAINAEGQVVIAGFTPSASQRTAVASRTVNISDGRLTLDARGGSNTKVLYVDVAKPALLQQPSVRSVSPAPGATAVRRDAAVTAELVLPNVGAGVDQTTIGTSAVRLERVSDGAVVPANVNTSGGGDVIVLQPTTVLAATTQYRFVVTSALKDIAGASFVAHTSTFTTGTEGGGSTPTTASFTKVALPSATGYGFTSLAFGPDGKLYAGTLDGEIVRFAINADGTTGTPEVLTSLQTAEGGARHVIGLAFDPASTASNLVLWVSHGYYAFSNAPDWTGKITRLSGSTLSTVRDYVVGLPRSIRDHETNSLAFGPDGALYVLQGSNTASGAPDSQWGLRPERLLTGAVLRVTPGAISTPPLNVKTADGGTYNPSAAGAAVTLWATGIRNAFDLVWHSNGQLYVPTNGSAAGGSTPSTPSTLPASCSQRIDAATKGAYTGPSVTGLADIATAQPDLLFRVVKGGYYGHPNAARCEWVLNGGNPTSGSDPVQVPEYPQGVQPDRNWRGAAWNFGIHYSPNGVIEYKGTNFGGSLKGKLLVVRYSAGDDLIALTPGGTNLDITGATTGIPGLTGFSDPLDVVERAGTGNLYVTEMGASRITLLKANG